MKPVLLDLFCGAGGAAKGYQEAGFYVVGIDIKAQPRYAGDEFIQGDALEYLATADLSRYSATHASPPCQGYSIMRNLPWLKDREYPMLIEPVRCALDSVGLPYVIENVATAPLAANYLCGLMFGLPLFRHRLFETNFFWLAPGHPSHRGLYVRSSHSMAGRARDMFVKRRGEAPGKVSQARTKAVLGVEWMGPEAEFSQAIPPAYTKYIGGFLMQEVLARTTDNAAPLAADRSNGANAGRDGGDVYG